MAFLAPRIRASLLNGLVLVLVALIQIWPGNASALEPEGPDRSDWHRLVGILQYLEADYPEAVETQSEFELNEQSEFIAAAISIARGLGEEVAPFTERLLELQPQIDAGVKPEEVSRECADIIEGLVEAGGLERSPRRPPELAQAAEIYANHCAACHGVSGDGDTPLAKTMEPPPTDFLDAETMEGASPYRAFNSISFGVEGTAMTAFNHFLDEDERWSLAFYVFSLRHDPCEKAHPGAELDVLASSTDGELIERFGPEALACLRTKPPQLELQGSLEIARQKVLEVKSLWAAGDQPNARRTALDAYLEGLEPVEPLIGARDRKLVLELEKAFLDLRLATENRGVEVDEAAAKVLVLLEEASGQSAATPWATFWFSLLIIIREGFEAMVVITALVAVLRRTEQMKHLKMVHLGWISALLVGALAFILGQQLLAGANREWMEGLIALVAAVMLIYAVMWMNSHTNIRKLMGDLREQMGDAAGKGSALGVFVVTFSAVLRESFETALFLQGLATDSLTGTLWGAGVGGLALLFLIFGMLRLGLRLPMQQLFRVSTWILCATAVVLLGKGLSAFQEVGALPLVPIPFIRIDLLGVRPDAISLFPQLILSVIFVIWLRRKGQSTPKPAAAAPSPG